MGETVWAIVVAGGSGRRFGSPKQFELLHGRPIVEWSVTAARSVADGIVLVVPSAMSSDLELARLADRVEAGGSTRAASVRSGLSAVPEDAGVVVVHDAARPLASPALFRSVVEAVRAGSDGAIPGLPILDTVKVVKDHTVTETLDRNTLVRIQTPQAFRANILLEAHAGPRDATDDAALLEVLGYCVVVVPGEETNLKITSRSDLALAEWHCRSGTLEET